MKHSIKYAITWIYISNGEYPTNADSVLHFSEIKYEQWL